MVTTGGVEEGICKINGNGGNGEKEKRKKLNILLENLNKTFFLNANWAGGWSRVINGKKSFCWLAYFWGRTLKHIII